MLVLLMIALFGLSIWGLVFMRRYGLIGGCLAVLLVGSCLGHPFYHVNVGPLPITADRVLLGAVLALYLLYRSWGQVERRGIDRLDILVLALIAVLAFSTFTHDWHAHGSRALASLLFFYLMPVTVYMIVRESPLSRRSVWGVLGTLAGFGFYLAVTSILEQRQMWSLVFPRYIVSPEHAEFLGRGRGPFLNPIGNGMFMCAGYFSLLMFWSRVGRTGKGLLLLCALIYLTGIYCTLTRVVWLSAAAGTLMILALNLPRRWSVAAVATAAVVAVSVLATKWEDLNAFKRDQYVSVAEMSQSASLRPILAYVAWQMYLDRPVLGCGYRQYDAVADHYLADRSTRLRLERARQYTQHNVFLALLAETGIVGLGLFLLFLSVLTLTSWRLWRAGDAALPAHQVGLLTLLIVMSYVVMANFHDLSLIPMIHMLLFFLAGMTRNLHGQRCGAAERKAAGERDTDQTVRLCAAT